jgi:DUF1707 SHOCT-like domain
MSEEPQPPASPSPSSPPQPGELRVSDQDRERVITALNEHAGAGRLTTEELEERVQAVYDAKTQGQLDAVRRDLPVTAQEAKRAYSQRRAQLSRRMLQQTGGSAGLFVVCTAIWLASGATGAFWPVWILIIVALSAVRNGWALFGPGADLDEFERQLDQRRGQRSERRQRRIERRSGH